MEDPRRFGDQLLQMDGVSLAGFSSEKVFPPTVCLFVLNQLEDFTFADLKMYFNHVRNI